MQAEREITVLLRNWSNGDERSRELAMTVIYDELRRCAGRLFSRENSGHTLQPTALVHEACARLMDADISWQDQTHFFALSARVMKRLLIDHANARRAQKRGGDAVHVTLSQADSAANSTDVLLIDLADALEELEALDDRKARLIEMQYFGGLTVAEMEVATGLSSATIGRELRFARAWLKDRLNDRS